MKVSMVDHFTVEHARQVYGLDGWGNRYFSILEDGRLAVDPTRRGEEEIGLLDVVERLRGDGLGTPVLLRFPQILQSQLRQLVGVFQRSISEFDYPGSFQPVYPIKVNQSLAVVNGLLDGAGENGLGLEVGSRSELLAAAVLPAPPGSLLICNGFKDREYLSAADLAARLGKPVVVVIEKPFEVEPLIEMAREAPDNLRIGVRIRLQAKGSGLWEKSGGFASKFGLTTLQLLRTIRRLEKAGLADRLVLLHFHIGSQVTEIRKVKNAVREATRVYAKLRGLGAAIRYLDVGGGLGIDYDGSRTSSDASVNYNVQEYANDVVYTMGEVCREEGVDAPVIVTEAGRMLTAYHAVLVTDVRDVITGADPMPPTLTGDENEVIRDLAEIEKTISVKNYREFYHDAIEYRDRMHSMFGLGMLDLEDRAKGENLFWKIAKRTVRFARTAKFMAEEFVELESRLPDQYICNVSVFQSLPDHWALDQLFPILPIHRLNEAPTNRATLVDITCDSDGDVDRFVDRKDLKESLEVHPLRDGEQYYLGFVLVGAYQDTMGDLHNLFGRVNEATVVLEPGQGAVVSGMRHGERAHEALQAFGYHEADLVRLASEGLQRSVARGDLVKGEAQRLLEDYGRSLGRYTYLDRD